jgi:hypothetical protein
MRAFTKAMQQILQSIGRGFEGMRSDRSGRLAHKAVRYRRSVTIQIFLAAAFFLALTARAQGQTSATLQDVHIIDVDTLGSGSSAEAMRQRITERIEKSGRVKIVQSPSAADAVLRGTSSIWATGTISLDARSKSSRQTTYQGYLSVELVGKGGESLWSYLVTISEHRNCEAICENRGRIVSGNASVRVDSHGAKTKRESSNTQVKGALHRATPDFKPGRRADRDA